MTAICKITVIATKKGYSGDSQVGTQWGQLDTENVSIVDREYTFQKFEDGWKLRP